jgi:hypothetical protein
VVAFPQVSPPKSCMHLSFPPYVLLKSNRLHNYPQCIIATHNYGWALVKLFTLLSDISAFQVFSIRVTLQAFHFWDLGQLMLQHCDPFLGTQPAMLLCADTVIAIVGSTIDVESLNKSDPTAESQSWTTTKEYPSPFMRTKSFLPLTLECNPSSQHFPHNTSTDTRKSVNI